MNRFFRKIAAASVLLGGLGSVAHAEVGRVLMAVGESTALRNGQTISLTTGSLVEAGDTLRVGAASNLQVRFTDEGVVALRPGSVFKIDDYRFSGNAASDSLLFSLIKGGMRTITGLIGRNIKQNYAVRAETATIGIRGTHFTLVACKDDCRNFDGSLAPNGTFGGVSDGRIVAKNEAGEGEFGKNEFFHVPSAKELPKRLLAPPSFLRDRLEGASRSKGRENPPEVTTVAEASGTTGDSRLMALTTPEVQATQTSVATAQPALVTGGLVEYSFASAEAWTSGFNVEGSTDSPRSTNPTSGFSAAAGNVYWGINPNSGSATGSHFAFGDAPTAIPTSGTATYTRIGGTTPTDSLGNSATSISGGNISVNYAAKTAQLVTPLVYSFSATGYQFTISTPSPVSYGTTNGYATVSGSCTGGCSVTAAGMNGAYTGKNAEGAIVSIATSGTVGTATVQVYKK